MIFVPLGGTRSEIVDNTKFALVEGDRPLCQEVLKTFNDPKNASADTKQILRAGWDFTLSEKLKTVEWHQRDINFFQRHLPIEYYKKLYAATLDTGFKLRSVESATLDVFHRGEPNEVLKITTTSYVRLHIVENSRKDLRYKDRFDDNSADDLPFLYGEGTYFLSPRGPSKLYVVEYNADISKNMSSFICRFEKPSKAKPAPGIKPTQLRIR